MILVSQSHRFIGGIYIYIFAAMERSLKLTEPEIAVVAYLFALTSPFLLPLLYSYGTLTYPAFQHIMAIASY